METIQVGNSYPGVQLVEIGEGPVLIQNADLTNTIYLANDNTVTVGNVAQNIPLSPQSFLVVDGQKEVWAIAAASVVLVHKIPGGLSFFQSGISGTSFLINKNGIFIYSTPLPTLNGLIFSISPNLTDGFGNLVFPGISAYSGVAFSSLAGTGLNIEANGHQVGLLFWDNSGPSPLTYLSTNGNAFSQLVSDTMLAIDPNAANTAESWHTIPLASGWSTVGGQPIPKYRLLPDGNVQVNGVATHTTFTSNTQFSTSGGILAAYRPATLQVVSGHLQGDAIFELSTAGTVTANIGTLASAGTCRFNGTYPLNN